MTAAIEAGIYLLIVVLMEVLASSAHAIPRATPGQAPDTLPLIREPMLIEAPMLNLPIPAGSGACSAVKRPAGRPASSRRQASGARFQPPRGVGRWSPTGP